MPWLRKRYGKLGSSLMIGLVVCLLTQMVGTGTDVLRRLDRGILAMMFHLREPGAGEENPYVSRQVRLLGYDEEALAAIGQWPWPRYVHARFLEKIERFSPEAVLFDTVFSEPQSIPPYVSERLAYDPDLEGRMRRTFLEMDREFADTLARYRNIYLVLQLVENQDPELPAGYLERIKANEKALGQASLPLRGQGSPMVFRSLRPVLEQFIENASPVVTNVLRDEDGMVRFFPLYFTYHGSDNASHHVFSVVLSLLQRYFRVDRDDIAIEPDRVLLRRAKVPVLDEKTRQPRLFPFPTEEISSRVENPLPPAGYAYNKNLNSLLVGEGILGVAPQDPLSAFPLPLLVGRDGGLRILGNWEVYDAALTSRAAGIACIRYEERDLPIDTPLGGFFYINYAGRQERYVEDARTGNRASFFPIPTGSYADVYRQEDAPDIPELDPSGLVRTDTDRKALEAWFLRTHRGDPAKEVVRSLAPPIRDRLMMLALLSYYRESFEAYANKFVFIGANKPGLGDTHYTPYGAMFGVNVLINAFNTLITGNPLTLSADVPWADGFSLLLLCLVCGLAYSLVPARAYGYLFVGMVVATGIAGIELFMHFNFYLSMARLLLASLILFLSYLVLRLFTEERDKRFLRKTFESYLSPVVIRQLYEQGTMPKLGGEGRTVTVFFADLQGFSSLAEKLTAEQLVELLNEYFGALTGILLDAGGTLDKFEGDAIVAFFGAPLDLCDHPLRAMQVALRMQEGLAGLCRKWRHERKAPHEEERNRKGLPPEEWPAGAKWPDVVHELRLRIGIHTGPVVVGNIGSRSQMNYTVMGDAVNIASRLEKVCKHYGVSTLVTRSTLSFLCRGEQGDSRAAGDGVDVRKIDTITLYGKSEAVEIYELVSLRGGLSPREEELIRVFGQAMSLYLNREWDAAIERFEACLPHEGHAVGEVSPSLIFLSRCQGYKLSPPVPASAPWDGVHFLHEK